jgi:ribosomal protein S18 acetylase RimI-like enzyme
MQNFNLSEERNMENEIRTLTHEDIPKIMALQMAYLRRYPLAQVIGGETYLSPIFEGGQNVFCAFNSDGKMSGYAGILLRLAEKSDAPHIAWAIVKVDPEFALELSLKDMLFDRIRRKAKEATQAYPGNVAQLTFEHHPSESNVIEYLLSVGCSHVDTSFQMTYDLTGDIMVIPVTKEIETREWHMETEEEQQAYVEARNASNPNSPTTVAELQYFVKTYLHDTGTTFAAFSNGIVIGCVDVYWIVAENRLRERASSHMDNVFVRAGWREKGIASHLIYRGFRYLKEHGFIEVRLEVRSSNEDALRLYKKLGYKTIDERRFYALEI